MAVLFLRVVAAFIVIELYYWNCVLFCHHSFHVEDCSWAFLERIANALRACRSIRLPHDSRRDSCWMDSRAIFAIILCFFWCWGIGWSWLRHYFVGRRLMQNRSMLKRRSHIRETTCSSFIISCSWCGCSRNVTIWMQWHLRHRISAIYYLSLLSIGSYCVNTLVPFGELWWKNQLLETLVLEPHIEVERGVRSPDKLAGCYVYLWYFARL